MNTVARSAAALFLVMTFAGAANSDDRITAANHDYAPIKARSQNDDLYLYVRYLIVPREAETEINWEAALRFAIPSASLETNLNRQLPLKIADGVYRIDLRGLGWKAADLIEVLKVQKYPYSHHANPLCIRGDWLIYQLSDQSESIAYPRLLFGANQPKNRDEWLQRLGVDRKEVERLELNHGLIETQSGVAVQSGSRGQKIRVLEFFDRLGGYASGTRDFLKVDADNSPLERIDFKGLKHDGEEWIIGLPKFWYADREYGIAESGRGALQYYFLAAGDGSIVAEAPLKLVEDHSKFKGVASIRNPGSCVSCHIDGLNPPTRNGLKHWIESGVELKAKSYDARQFAERFHLTGTAKVIERSNADFAETIVAACGVKPAEAVGAYIALNDYYRSDVTLEIAAAELGATAEELKLAIAYASEQKIEVGGHLASLAHGVPIGRFTFESLYLKTEAYLQAWRTAKGKK
jgi:hypothetical protein